MAGQGPDPEQLSNFTVAALMDCSYNHTPGFNQMHYIETLTKWSCMYIKYPLLSVPKLAEVGKLGMQPGVG